MNGRLLWATQAMTVAFRALAAVIGVLACVVQPAWGNTLVVFTVDVESNETFRLPDQVDAVCQDGSPCGLMEIVRRLEERHMAGTFFLNVYEQSRWGQTAMRDIARRLQTAGQEVGLHTHPETAFDPKRTEMYQYTLDEQTEIVRDGARLILAWTGVPVASHRAGDYSANEDTLIALERNGVPLDSSRFWTAPNSRLEALGLPRNLPAWHGRVVEIPVTVYQREDRLNFFGAALPPVTAVRKIDVDWFANAAEMRGAIDAAVASDLPVLVVFLHSFSFMGARTDGAPRADQHAADMFRDMLDYIARKQLAVVTMRQLATGKLPGPAVAVGDIVPSVTVRVDLLHYVRRWSRASPLLSSASALGIMLLSACAVLVVRRWRSAGAPRISARGIGGSSLSPATREERSR